MKSSVHSAVRRDDDGPVQIILYQAADDADEPNLDCDDSDPGSGVECTDIPFNDCCQGEENDLFDSAKNNQAEGWESFRAYTGTDDDACRQVITQTREANDDCLAGGFLGMTITGASVEGETEMERDVNRDDMAKGGKDEKSGTLRKRRAVRANLYTYRSKDRMIYNIPIDSPLGEQYRRLATKQEKYEFMAKHGVARAEEPGQRICVRASRA